MFAKVSKDIIERYKAAEQADTEFTEVSNRTELMKETATASAIEKEAESQAIKSLVSSFLRPDVKSRITSKYKTSQLANVPAIAERELREGKAVELIKPQTTEEALTLALEKLTSASASQPQRVASDEVRRLVASADLPAEERQRQRALLDQAAAIQKAQRRETKEEYSEDDLAELPDLEQAEADDETLEALGDPTSASTRKATEEVKVDVPSRSLRSRPSPSVTEAKGKVDRDVLDSKQQERDEEAKQESRVQRPTKLVTEEVEEVEGEAEEEQILEEAEKARGRATMSWRTGMTKHLYNEAGQPQDAASKQKYFYKKGQSPTFKVTRDFQTQKQVLMDLGIPGIENVTKAAEIDAALGEGVMKMERALRWEHNKKWPDNFDYIVDLAREYNDKIAQLEHAKQMKIFKGVPATPAQTKGEYDMPSPEAEEKTSSTAKKKPIVLREQVSPAAKKEEEKKEKRPTGRGLNQPDIEQQKKKELKKAEQQLTGEGLDLQPRARRLHRTAEKVAMDVEFLKGIRKADYKTHRREIGLAIRRLMKDGKMTEDQVARWFKHRGLTNKINRTPFIPLATQSIRGNNTS